MKKRTLCVGTAEKESGRNEEKTMTAIERILKEHLDKINNSGKDKTNTRGGSLRVERLEYQGKCNARVARPHLKRRIQ